MRRPFSWILAGSLVLGLTSVALADDLVPRRYNPRSLDRSLTLLEVPGTSTVWSAWSYRNQGEYDLAVSVRGPDGEWSDPEWIGFGDGIDQLRPALAIDSDGHLYLAWAEARTGRILLSVRPRGATAWSPATVLTGPDGRGTAPSLSVIGGRLVAAWREGTGVEIVDLGPTLASATAGISIRTIQDGADPLGLTGEGADPEGEELEMRDPNRHGDGNRPRPPRRDDDGIVDRRGRSNSGG